MFIQALHNTNRWTSALEPFSGDGTLSFIHTGVGLTEVALLDTKTTWNTKLITREIEVKDLIIKIFQKCCTKLAMEN